mgnify:CR=1 FL=1
MSQTDDSEFGFDDLPESEDVERGDQGNWINLDGAGDEVTGTVTDFNPHSLENGVVEIDGNPLRMNASVKWAIIRNLIVGADIAVRHGNEQKMFENDDGEEIEYYDKEVRVRPPSGGDS